jgi:hypothetical protein
MTPDCELKLAIMADDGGSRRASAGRAKARAKAKPRGTDAETEHAGGRAARGGMSFGKRMIIRVMIMGLGLTSSALIYRTDEGREMIGQLTTAVMQQIAAAQGVDPAVVEAMNQGNPVAEAALQEISFKSALADAAVSEAQAVAMAGMGTGTDPTEGASAEMIAAEDPQVSILRRLAR